MIPLRALAVYRNEVQLHTFGLSPHGQDLNLAGETYDNLPCLSLLASPRIFLRNTSLHFCLRAFGCASLQQLPLITAGWVRAEQSGLRAFPRSCGLIYRVSRAQMKSLFPYVLRRRPNTGLFGLASSSWILP